MKKRLDLKKGGMLFAFFFKIGCFTFGGGWSILAQMEKEFVERKQMITKEELMDLVAAGRSLPGIMITNISMLFGYEVGGWFGGLCAILGISCPAVLILSLVTCFYTQVKNSELCRYALKGIQAAVIPIIGCSAVSLGKDVLKSRKGKGIFIIALVFSLFTQISNIEMVLLGVVAAVIWKGVKDYVIH